MLRKYDALADVAGLLPVLLQLEVEDVALDGVLVGVVLDGVDFLAAAQHLLLVLAAHF